MALLPDALKAQLPPIYGQERNPEVISELHGHARRAVDEGHEPDPDERGRQRVPAER